MRKPTMENASGRPIVMALVVVGMLAGAAWAAPQQPSEPGFAWKDGAEVYTKVCALCHETNTGPAIRGRGLDPMYIRLIIRNGYRAMPAFRASEIDDEVLEKLAEYISKTTADQ